MLHELLLALSGHPSPLLSVPIGKAHDGLSQDLFSPAETALLSTLARDLGEKHKNIREGASRISTSHISTVCRSVSTAIVSTHLAAFQQKILEVERGILDDKSDIDGAYNSIPLSGLVGAFDGWKRTLEWLWNLIQFIQPNQPNGTRRSESGQQPCTSSQILERLRGSIHTGYPDIEQISFHLVRVAETTWLKQLCAWVLYGRLPSLDASDLFVNKIGGEYGIDYTLVPGFVTKSTASSILFIGKSLNHIRDSRSGIGDGSTGSSPEMELLPSHLAHLSSLESPINSSSFSAAVSAIRLSLSKNALQKLLPTSKVIEILRVLKDFFLLERGEFALALISAADERLTSRHNRSFDMHKQKGLEGLGNVTIKEGEASAILARTWNTLSSLQDAADDDEDNEDLDLARDLFRLSIKPTDPQISSEGRPPSSTSDFKLNETAFNDFLLPTPTILSFSVPSPQDLVLSSSNVNVYSQINAYLLAIRRGHLRLSRLFLLSPLRRDHPSPKAPNHQIHKAKLESFMQVRRRFNRRARTMRSIWAIIGSATFLLTELGDYFQGQVIKGSWSSFHAWLDPSVIDRPSSSSSGTKQSFPVRPSATHDPETLSLAHNAYLSALTHALLLSHPPFTHSLRVFLLSITHLAALMNRLSTVQQALDLEKDAGVVDTLANYTSEETELIKDLHEAGKGIEKGVKSLLRALGDWEGERVEQQQKDDGGGGGGFVPWGGAGVERLLLKIDWARRLEGTV